MPHRRMNIDREARAAQRALRTELACARALLDALEAVLDADSAERTQAGILVQMAEQFARMANTMNLSNGGPSEIECSEPRCDTLLAAAPQTGGVEKDQANENDADAKGPNEGIEIANESERKWRVVLTNLAL